MYASYNSDEPNALAPFSIVPGKKALTRLINENRHRDEPHGREYKCKTCNEWLPCDTEFYSPRKRNGDVVMAKTCRVCERVKSGRGA